MTTLTEALPRGIGPAAKLPRISVVIPVRDSERDLACCLDSLATQTFPAEFYEILVVDDGSRDGTPDLAASRGARVLRQDRRGASEARNRGAREARGEIVLFLDADCVADPRWMEELSRALLGDEAIAATVGRYDSRQSSLVARFVQLELDARYDRMRDRDRIDFLNSGNCGFRRDTILRYPFDEKFQRLEDVELSFRVARDGHPLIFVFDALAYHRHPASVSALLRRKFNYARYVVPLYRQYPEKSVTDASTPPTRRARIVATALALVFLSMAVFVPSLAVAALLMALISVALSAPIIARAFGRSTALGLVAPFLILLGNLAFVAGTARGLTAGKAPESN